MGKGLQGSHPHAKFYTFGLVNVGLLPKILSKMLIVYIFPKGDFYKILPAKFPRCSFKTVAVWHQKSPKIVFFCKNLPLGKNSGGR